MAEEALSRKEVFPVGIAGVSMGSIEREIPADEPAPLPVNAELSVIGRGVARQDGRAKVTGAARFTVDVKLPNMLHARVLRSPHPHAQVLSLDTSAAERHPGVRALLVIADPAKGASAATLRYVGAPVLAAAAVSESAAREALALVAVRYKTLPFVTDFQLARRPEAPSVHDSESLPQGSPGGYPAPAGVPVTGNVRGPALAQRGDIAQGFEQADVIVEEEFSTQVQTHCCAETHAVVADWRADGLTVYISTQYTAGARKELAQAFGLPLAKVRVVVEAMGGGFGSKSALGGYGRFAVALSRMAGAPVRLVHDRHEEHLDTGNRPATWQRLRVGARRDGTLTAISLVSYGTAGVALGAGVGNFAQALYACPNFQNAQHDVFINAGPACPMRAPGNTQGAWGMEQVIDMLAERLAIDPLALRDRIDPSPVRREERRIGAQRIGWQRRGAPGSGGGPVLRGIGVAQSVWGANVQITSSCEVRLHRDGSIELLSGVQDIGTGIGTVLAQVVAEELGVRPEQVLVRIGDTDFPPGPPSHGSRTTASITPPARTAAWRVKQALLREIAPALGAAPGDLELHEGRVRVRGDASRSLALREAAARLRGERISAVATRSDDYGGFGHRMGDAAQAQNDLGGVQFAQVAVDARTGIVRVERVVAVHDCGRPMNPLQLESQIQGGVLMGVSYALFEERVMDEATGRMVNADLEAYKILGAADAPQIEVVILENYQGRSATDAYGVAEPSNLATAAAVGNAFYNATGVRMRSLPMTPAAVLAALAAGAKGGAA